MYMYNWDYNLPKDWKPQTHDEWVWYLQRKINYEDWDGIRPWMLKKYVPVLKLDPARRFLIDAYLDRYGRDITIPAHA